MYRSERDHIREVLGNVMLYGKDKDDDERDVYLGIYLENGEEYYYKRHNYYWTRLDSQPRRTAMSCGFAILVEQFILGFDSTTYIYVINYTDTFPGNQLDFGCTRIKVEEVDVTIE